MTLNRYITVADIMATKPCRPHYTKEKVEQLFSGRKRVRLSTVLNSGIPHEDKIWLVTRFLPGDTNCKFARWCALQVVYSWDCPAIVMQYLETGDESIIDAVLTADGNAVRSAGRAAAMNAVWAAASDAVSDTAWYTLHAALAGASAAQIEKLKEMMNQ